MSSGGGILGALLNLAVPPKNKDEVIHFSSVEEFDDDLANEIQNALRCAGADDGQEEDEDFCAIIDELNSEATINAVANGRSKETRLEQDIDFVITEQRRVDKPKQPQPTLPPHTNLALILANEHGISLSSVSPSSSSPKITGADVKFHVYQVRQPAGCTFDALALGYEWDMDLNEIYDGRPLTADDVRFYRENLSSLKMSSQTMKGEARNGNGSSADEGIENEKKLAQRDERMERNMERLSRSAMKLANAAADVMDEMKSTFDGGAMAEELMRTFISVGDVGVPEKSRMEKENISLSGKKVEDVDEDESIIAVSSDASTKSEKSTTEEKNSKLEDEAKA